MEIKSKPSATPADEGNTSLAAEKQRLERALTVPWHEAPEWMRDNHYLLSGYRPPSNSYAKSLASLGYAHNESVNIWTHLVGAVVAALTGATLFLAIRPRFALATHHDVLAFACFFLGAVACLGLSASFHTLSNHSQAVARFGNRLDYVGIIFLIWGSFIPSIYYGFSAEPALIRVYWSMITTIAAGTLVVVLSPQFRTSAWRPFRAFMFVMMGLSAVFPVAHGWRKYGFAQMERQMGLSWVVGQGALYILGAMIYAARIPERWNPGAFDLLGSSHQIFHLLVLSAATVHLVGLVKAFDYGHGLRGGAVPGL